MTESAHPQNKAVETRAVPPPFDVGLETLTSEKFSLISFPEYVWLGADSSDHASRALSFINLSVVYGYRVAPKLVSSLFTLDVARAATGAHTQGKEHYFDQTFLAEKTRQSVAFPAHEIVISPSDFEHHLLTTSLFGEKAAFYKTILEERGIRALRVRPLDASYVDREIHAGKSFARQATAEFSNTGELGLFGVSWLDQNPVRGVRHIDT